MVATFCETGRVRSFNLYQVPVGNTILYCSYCSVRTNMLSYFLVLAFSCDVWRSFLGGFSCSSASEAGLSSPDKVGLFFFFFLARAHAERIFLRPLSHAQAGRQAGRPADLRQCYKGRQPCYSYIIIILRTIHKWHSLFD